MKKEKLIKPLALLAAIGIAPVMDVHAQNAVPPDATGYCSTCDPDDPYVHEEIDYAAGQIFSYIWGTSGTDRVIQIDVPGGSFFQQGYYYSSSASAVVGLSAYPTYYTEDYCDYEWCGWG